MFKSVLKEKQNNSTPMVERISPAISGKYAYEPENRVQIVVQVQDQDGQWKHESTFMFQSLYEIIALVRNRVQYDGTPRKVTDDRGYLEIIRKPVHCISRGVRL